MSTNVPGVIQPVVLPYPAGANSARTAGIAIGNKNNTQQTNLIGTVKGGYKKKIYKGGATSQIAVPTFQVLYPEPGAANQTVNGNITSTTKLGATTSANSVYDSCIGQGPSCTSQVATTGGKRIKKGGVKWGCYSGGSHKKSKKIKGKKLIKSKNKTKYSKKRKNSKKRKV